MYIIADGAFFGSNWQPILPEGTSYQWLASPLPPKLGEFEKFALYKIPYIEPEEHLPSFEVVSRELDNLLNAAKMYPPAMAIIRDEVKKVIEDRKIFSALLIERLRFRLESQKNAPYVLARAVRNNNSYKSIGSYYWLVGFSKVRTRMGSRTFVLWVSEDYFVYDDPLTDFDIDEAWLRERFS